MAKPSISKVKLTWMLPQIRNGVVLKYILQYFRLSDGKRETESLSNLAREADVDGLYPNELYKFVLQAETGGGVGHPAVVTIMTQTIGEETQLGNIFWLHL